MGREPIVSIICLAYQHEKYITRALDGFVEQRTRFPFEVLINDDASSDGTAEIIREYASRYPDIIKPVYQTENQYSQGISITRTYLLPKARGKYVAFCEGDDYWCDSAKLQKQVDFLESHSEYAMCTHRVRVEHIQTGRVSTIPGIRGECDYSADEIIRGGAVFQMSSVLLRTEDYRRMPECFFVKGFGDIQVYMYSALIGKVRVLADVMSVYNHGTSGSWTQRMDNDEKQIIHANNKIKMLNDVNAYYHYKHDAAFRYAVDREQFNILYYNGDKKSMRQPQYRHFLKKLKRNRMLAFLRKYFPWLMTVKNAIRGKVK